MAEVKDSCWLNPLMKVMILHLTATRPFSLPAPLCQGSRNTCAQFPWAIDTAGKQNFSLGLTV